MIFQSHMEALRAEPVAEGEMPASSVPQIIAITNNWHILLLISINM